MQRVLLGVVVVACATCGISCAEALAPLAAAAGARTAAQATASTAAAVADAVPQAVQAMVDALVAKEQPTWGNKPQTVYITPRRYVLIYPTPEAERKKGHLRMVVVNRESGLARIQRLQENRL